MSENITHTAVTDDCSRLAVHAPGVCEEFKQVLSEHRDVARLGGIARGADEFTVDLFSNFRDAYATAGKLDESLARKLAFTLGWLCHRAADRQMKPVFRELDPDCDLSPTDCSIYHDVFLFREVYGEGEEHYIPALLEPSLNSLPGAEGLNADAVEDLLRAVWQRALLGLHTFIPDPNDIEGWISRLISTRQTWRVDIQRYAEAYANPDPEKLRRFIEEPNFYNPKDPVIRLARSIQHGEPLDMDVTKAVEAGFSQSQYARALSRGYIYIESATQYWEYYIEEDRLAQMFQIGEPDY
jgi:hypothetical protein